MNNKKVARLIQKGSGRSQKEGGATQHAGN